MLSPLLTRILHTLQQGHWVFEDLGPAFRKALIDRIFQRSLPANGIIRESLETWPLYCLACVAYDVIQTVPVSEEARSDPFVGLETVSQQTFWPKAANYMDSRARVRAVRDPERHQLSTALERLKATRPESHRVFSHWVEKVCMLEGRVLYGASHPHLFGVLFFDEQLFEEVPEDVPVSLVHELGHQELFLLNVYDRLVSEGADAQLAWAPFQQTERPPIGRLHSAHALFRMIQQQDAGGRSSRANRLLLRETIATFQPGELTPFASALMKQVYEPTTG